MLIRFLYRLLYSIVIYSEQGKKLKIKYQLTQNLEEASNEIRAMEWKTGKTIVPT